MTENNKYHQLGPHNVRVEGDTCHFFVSGALSLEQAMKMHGFLQEALSAYGRAYAIVHFPTDYHVDPQTRRWIAEWHKQHHLSGVAFFGATLVQRAVATLIVSAAGLFRKEHLPTVFVKTESDARDWVAKQRPQSSQQSV